MDVVVQFLLSVGRLQTSQEEENWNGPRIEVGKRFFLADFVQRVKVGGTREQNNFGCLLAETSLLFH